MRDELSTAIMKYGFEGDGQAEGLGERHAAGSASASAGVSNPAAAATAPSRALPPVPSQRWEGFGLRFRSSISFS
jgi:hypothetical protein